MQIMSIELAKDLFHFQPINEKSFSPSANQSDMDAAAKEALIIAKTHIDKIFIIVFEKSSIALQISSQKPGT